MLVARRFVLSGRVQGVGFRYFAAEAAHVEGLGGWVQNLLDRDVEIFVEGEADAVTRFEGKIRRGPPAARVETVSVHEEPASGAHRGFRIRHDSDR